MKFTLFLLWIMVVLIPALVGRNIYRSTLESAYSRKIQQFKHELMTIAKESETVLAPARVIKHLLRYDRIHSSFKGYKESLGTETEFLREPLAMSLPNPNKDLKKELKIFNIFFQSYTGINPAFLAYAEKDQAKCRKIINHSFSISPEADLLLQKELATMAANLDQHMLYEEESTPGHNRRLAIEQYPAFYSMTGIFDFLSSGLWRLSGGYSSKVNGRLDFLFIRYPGFDSVGKYVIIGVPEKSLPAKIAIKSFLVRNQQAGKNVSFGFTKEQGLPYYYQTKGCINLLYEIPFDIRQIFEQQEKPPPDLRPVLNFSFNFTDLSEELNRTIRFVDLIIYIFICLSLLFTLGFVFERLHLITNLRRCIIAAFIAANLFPVAGISWLAFSYSEQNEEIKIKNITNLLKQKIAETEFAFELQRARQQVLMRYFCFFLENMPGELWKSFAEKIDPGGKNQLIKRFLYNNYLLINNRAEEFTRTGMLNAKGQELRPIMIGADLKLLSKFGAFSSLSQTEQKKIGQFADISAGLTDRIVDQSLLNLLFSEEGSFQHSTTLARHVLLSANFLRRNSQVVGVLNFVTMDTHLYQCIAQLFLENSFPTTIRDGNFKIDLNFFPVSPDSGRKLIGRLQYTKYGSGTSVDEQFDLASGLYANSDSFVLNNLNSAEPHLLVTDVIFNKKVFVVIKAVPLQKGSGGKLLLPFLILLVSFSSCLAIAYSISYVLLTPVPPFVRAIRELRKEKFDWEISVNTGDQFDTLAISLNQMTIKMQERKKMMQIVSKTAIDAVSGDKTEIDLTPQYRQATVLFSDIRSFTTLSEKNSAEDVVEMLNEYFTLMGKAIERNDGFIDQMIGDAIQAVFYGDNDKERVFKACKTALEMQESLETYNENREKIGKFTIRNGIGIANGRIVSGLVGSSAGKLDSTILGVPLTLAQFLEGQSKNAKRSSILLDSNAHELIGKEAETEFLTIESGEPAFELICIKK